MELVLWWVRRNVFVVVERQSERSAWVRYYGRVLRVARVELVEHSPHDARVR